MANDFRNSIGAFRASALQGAMGAVGGNDSTTGFLDSAIQSGADQRMQALGKAQAWMQQGTSMFGDAGSQFEAMIAGAGKQGIQAVTSHAVHKQNVKAAKAAQRAQQSSGIAGAIGSGIGIIAGIFSDVRLKEAITPADAQLNDVRALAERLITYNYKPEAPLDDAIKEERQLGLRAQDAEAISPLLTRDVPLGDGDADATVKMLRLDTLLMKTLGAVGELAEKVEALEAKLTSLTAD